MQAHRFAVLAAMIVCLGGSALAQDDELPLSNWGAPPYWSPLVQPRAEGGPDGTMVARTQGMKAQAEALPSSPLPFVAITPCRIVDTRINILDGFHRPNFDDDETRTLPFPSSTDCSGLPATAGAWSVNIQFRPLTQLAYLTAYPTGITRPGVSTMTAGPAAWVQNAAIVPAGTSGAIDIYCQYAGRVVIDINGYYGPLGVVTSVNTLTGDVTLAEGSNVTITPSGNTLTIAASGGPGGVLPTGTTGQTLYNDGLGWSASSVLTNDGSDTVAVNGNLSLPPTTSAFSGVLTLGGAPFLHNYPGLTSFSTFVGLYAGNFAMTGQFNTAVGDSSLSSNTTGASNTAIGSNTLRANTTGNGNTGVGDGSLAANTTGVSNSALGAYSLTANTTGNRNAAVGVSSLAVNSGGSSNAALGAYTLAANTTGGYNAAIGSSSMHANTTGSQNVAVGASTLYNNTTASYNTTSGVNSLFTNTTGQYNTAAGYTALYYNTTGSNNVANGANALGANTIGSNNIAVGYNAGSVLTTGNSNIDIGNPGVAAEAGTIRIGSLGTHTRAFIAGISGVTTAGAAVPVLIDANGQLGTISSSSIRFKQDVTDMGAASSGLMQLRPVTFYYKADRNPSGRTLRYGLIAEEVERVMPELVVRDATGQPETVAYHELPAMLLNELQKQQAINRAQQAEIEALTAALAADRDQQRQLDAVTARLAALEANQARQR